MSATITADAMIPDLLREHPECREVLDRHGLQGCGGRLGPHETLRFFAQAHGAPLGELLREINAAVAAPIRATPAPAMPAATIPLQAAPHRETVADSIYRPFFAAAILVMLTAGCVWGAANLFQIGKHGDFFAVPTDWTLAHAHAQILGWAGLFVMGFGYQAFPRFRGQRLQSPGLAILSLGLMIGGIVLSAVAQTWSHEPGMIQFGLAGGALEIAAVTLFIGKVFQAMHAPQASSLKPQGSPLAMAGAPFIMAGLLAFYLQTAIGPFLFRAMATAPDELALIPLLAGWMPAFRELQVFGFISMMIFGVSLRLLPAIYGFGPIANSEEEQVELDRQNRRAASGIFRIYALSVAADMAGWIGLVVYHMPLFLGVLMASYVGLLASGILLVRRLGIFGPARNHDRSLKLVRAAYAWLLIGLVMLNAMFPYCMMTGQTFSHAFLGAVRHAVTVGFISLMILGVSSRVAPTLRGLDPKRLNPLWVPFVLINLGNLMRVTLQIATDFTPAAYALMGISGFIEVTGLILWAADLMRIMWLRPRVALA